MILPSPSADTAPYWEAARAGRFLLRYCAGCGRWRHPRESACCAGADLRWREASGRGTLLSFTTVRRALNPALAAQIPYTITLVRTVEGPHLLTSLPGDGHALHVGAPMRITYDPITDDITLPRFAPA